jgi:hypothetical protein
MCQTSQQQLTGAITPATWLRALWTAKEILLHGENSNLYGEHGNRCGTMDRDGMLLEAVSKAMAKTQKGWKLSSAEREMAMFAFARARWLWWWLEMEDVKMVDAL